MTRFDIFCLFVMIALALNDGAGTIELFGEYQADHLV